MECSFSIIFLLNLINNIIYSRFHARIIIIFFVKKIQFEKDLSSIFIPSFIHNFYKRFHDFGRERERERNLLSPLVYHFPILTTLISRFEFDISPKVDDRVSFPRGIKGADGEEAAERLGTARILLSTKRDSTDSAIDSVGRQLNRTRREGPCSSRFIRLQRLDCDRGQEVPDALLA